MVRGFDQASIVLESCAPHVFGDLEFDVVKTEPLADD